MRFEAYICIKVRQSAGKKFSLARSRADWEIGTEFRIDFGF